jgi:hypothetical protein
LVERRATTRIVEDAPSWPFEISAERQDQDRLLSSIRSVTIA